MKIYQVILNLIEFFKHYKALWTDPKTGWNNSSDGSSTIRTQYQPIYMA